MFPGGRAVGHPIRAFTYLSHQKHRDRQQYNGFVPRKPKPITLPPRLVDSRQFLTALLAVKKDELQKIEKKLKKVRQATRRQNP